MTTRDVQLSRHLRVNVGKEDDGGWPEHEEQQVAAALAPFIAFCQAIRDAPDATPQWIREGAKTLLSDDSNDGQDWRG